MTELLTIKLTLTLRRNYSTLLLDPPDHTPVVLIPSGKVLEYQYLFRLPWPTIIYIYIYTPKDFATHQTGSRDVVSLPPGKRNFVRETHEKTLCDFYMLDLRQYTHILEDPVSDTS